MTKDRVETKGLKQLSKQAEVRLKMKALEELAASENRYRLLADNTIDVIWTMDMNLRFTYVNPAIMQMMGYTPEEWIGSYLTDHTDEEHLAKMTKVVADEIAKGHKSRGAVFETVMLKKDKTPILLEIHGRVLFDENGAPLSLQGVTRDITERKRTEEALVSSERRMRILLGNLPGMAYRCLNTPDWPMDFISEGAADLIGYRPEVLHPDGTLNFADFIHPEDKQRVWDTVQDKVQASSLFEIEYRVRTKSGEEKWVWERGRATPAETPEGVVLEGFIFDITDRKRAEEGLSKSEARYRKYIENAPEGIFVVDAEGKYVDVNESSCRMLGYSRDELLSLAIPDLAPPNAPPEAFASFAQLKETGAVQTEVVLRKKDGADIHVSLKAVALPEDRFMAFCSDITDRKQAEEALRQSKQILDATGEMAKIGGWEHDLTSGKAVWTKALYDIIEMPYAEDPPGVEEHLAYYPPHDCKIIHRAYTQAIKTGTPFDLELQVHTKSKKLIWCRVKGESIYENGRCVKLRGTFQDITDRKLAEEVLRENQKQLSDAMEIAHLAPWEYDVANDLFTFNDHFYNIFRITAEQVGGYTMSSAEYASRFVHPDDRDLVGIEVRKAIESTDPLFSRQIEHRILYGDGNIGHITVRFYIIKDEQGRTIKTYGVNQDITARKQAKEQFKELFETMPSGVAIYEATEDGADFVFKLFNRAGEKIEKIKREDVIGRKVTEVFPGVVAFGLLDVFKRVWKTGRPEDLPISIYKDDRIAGWRENHVFKLPSGEIVAVYEDLTAQKKVEEEKTILEEQFRQSQKMESIGRLAGGIAHDFNNLLTVIVNYTAMLLSSFQPTDPAYKDLTEIDQAADRAADLTRQLLAFSRKQIIEKKVIDINRIIERSQKMLRRIIGEDINLVFNPGADLKMVDGDAGQIDQILINLAVNARDAMSQGGKLVLATENVHFNDKLCRKCGDNMSGWYVMLSVTDNGVGMDKGMQDKIFEPFYTTKEVGKGTGLGLSTVFGIARQHGGHVNFSSEPGQGTTFRVYLPVSEKRAEEQKEDVKKAALHGHETILLIEDEDAVRRVTTRILQVHGYKVLEAANAGEALLLVKKHTDNIDLVLTDIVMPNMSGRECYKILSEIVPDLKVIYMSGYTENAIVHHGVLEEGIDFIQKPFSVDALARKVREVLDRKK